MRNIVLLLICLFGLLACVEDMPPIASGTAVYDTDRSSPSSAVTENGQAKQAVVLSAGQIQKLDQWLHSHRSGWTFLAGPPPRASIRISLVHNDGTRSDLDIILISYTGQPARQLVLTRQDHGGGILDKAARTLSNEEVAEFQGLIASGQ